MYYDDYEDDYNYDEIYGEDVDQRESDYDHGYMGSFPQGSLYTIPDPVQNFLMCLYKAITEKNSNEIRVLYENTFAQLTDTYYKDTPWPGEEEILSVIGQRENYKMFIIFYKELYFRHIYANCQPTIEQRLDSYKNYCALFNLLLSTDKPISLELNNQWLWDIIDEFIYQFQSCSLFRMRACSGKLSDHELEFIRQNQKMWNIHSVLNVLHSLVDKSNINSQLKDFNDGKDPNVKADIFGREPLYKMLGYFSLIGLLRLHSILGDYYQAIHVLENIDLQQHLIHNFAGVLACKTTTFYYVGFAYMMMKRYADAIRIFANMLVYIQRTKQIQPLYRTVQLDLIEKQTEQMYVLLNICLVLYPQRIDESVSVTLQQKLGDSMNKMQRGEQIEFENAFNFGCPKFLSPIATIHEIDTLASGSKEKFEISKQQLDVFMEEIRQQLPILNIRNYLKLYTTMPISKLANFLDIEEKELKLLLLAYKQKMNNLSCVDSSGKPELTGKFVSSSDIDFYIDKGMIHIADTKVERRYGDFFLRQINSFEDMFQFVSTIKLQQQKKKLPHTSTNTNNAPAVTNNANTTTTAATPAPTTA